MSPKQILIVAVRLIVLIGIVQTLSSIVTIFAQSGSEYNSAQLLLPLSIYGFYLAAWLLVWCFPATIANRLLPEHLQTAQEPPQTPCAMDDDRYCFDRHIHSFPSHTRTDLLVLYLSFYTIYLYRHADIHLGESRHAKPSRYIRQHRPIPYRDFPTVRRTQTLVLDSQKTVTT